MDAFDAIDRHLATIQDDVRKDLLARVRAGEQIVQYHEGEIVRATVASFGETSDLPHEFDHAG